MPYGQFGLFECMCCHKIATEDPGVCCPACTETLNSLLEAIDASPHGGAVWCDADNGWTITVEQGDCTEGWVVTQGMEDQPPVEYATYPNLMQVAAAFPQTRWSPLEVEEEG